MNQIKNNYTIEQLEILRDEIQDIENTEQNHLKILEILHNTSANFSENSNGVFINMNNLSDEQIKKMVDYLNYVKKQKEKFEQVENIKNKLKKEFSYL